MTLLMAVSDFNSMESGLTKMKLLTSVMDTAKLKRDLLIHLETNHSMYQDGEILKIRLLELTDGTIALADMNMMFTIFIH